MKRKMIYSIIKSAKQYNLSLNATLFFQNFLAKLDMYKDVTNEVPIYFIDEGIIVKILINGSDYIWSYLGGEFIGWK